ncbi:MAG: cbb3-type cytochrome c oxidase subunit I [Actinomycetes bacterium]
MAIQTQEHTSGSAPSNARAGGALMSRMNLVTAIIGGLIVMFAAHYLAAAFFVMPVLEGDAENPSGLGWLIDNRITLTTMFGWVLGFMLGIGAFNGPVRWVLGKDLTDADSLFLAGKDQGVGRYFRFTTDHKVVGIQYLIITMTLLGVGGTVAMMIRTNLMTPHSAFLGPTTYNTFVGMHGIIMIIATIIMVTGPFGNFILPIMIGARDMAFPRLNALSFWLIASVVPVLLSVPFLGGMPTGWTAYNPLASQGPVGMDGFIVTIIVFAVSSAVAGANITTTAVKMRTRGMTWTRTPIFVYGVVASVGLAIPAFPTFMAAQVLSGLDRGVGTSFYTAEDGGSGWLYANLFWLMGHPEVYVILIPAVAALLELTPVFTRKPLFSFKAAVIAIAGIVGLSVLVWAHHMYISGWAPKLGGPFMLTTEMISIPTGLLFLVFIGTMWRGRIWTRLPMMAVYAMLWNFVIGGVTGVYLSDIPVDEAMHGSMFVTAHFHYTLMGVALTGTMGALVFWFSKMTGRMFNERIGFWGFWIVQIGFNVTFLGMFMVGFAGQPRRVFNYSEMFANGNFVSTMGAYTIFIGMLIFLYTIISSWRGGEIASANPWNAKTLEWQVPTPVPLENFDVLPIITSDPYGYGRPTSEPKEGASR